MTDLPTGTVTFLFTDIEGSTGLLQTLGDRYPAVLDEHAAIIRRAVAEDGGVEVSTHGDEVLVSDATRGLVQHTLPGGVSLRDLGEHRLRGLEDPERLHQLVSDGLAADFPPPRTLDARPNNLPLQLTSFVGRES